ncbi:MAG: GNAT family N-acetyltransferase [Bacteroidota bacterium]
MIIRKATIDDIDVLAYLLDQYRIFYKQSSDIAGARQFLADRFAQNESVIFVVVLDNKIAGFTQLYPVFSSVGLKRAWLLNDLYVVPEARGSGSADALLKAAQEMGATTSSRWLLLQTAVTNHRAQRVYERNGWVKDKDYFSYYYYPGK